MGVTNSAFPSESISTTPLFDWFKKYWKPGLEADDATEPRERLWRAFTPQLFRRLQLTRALESARDAGVVVTDEAMAMERHGLRPLLIEGADDNFKITTAADLPLFEFTLSRR